MWIVRLGTVGSMKAGDEDGAGHSAKRGIEMLTRGIAALALTTAFSSGALAADLPQTPAGLVGGIDGAGEAPLDLADRPGFRLAKSFRLRLDMSDRLDAVSHGATPVRVALIDKSRTRRFSSMLDYYPVSDSGFRLTAGMRKLPRPSRLARNAFGAGATAFDLSGLGSTAALGSRSSIARRSPTMMAGWTGLIAKETQIGFSAGAAEEHGKSYLAGNMLGQGTAKRWSRVGEVAQVNFAMRF